MIYSVCYTVYDRVCLRQDSTCYYPAFSLMNKGYSNENKVEKFLSIREKGCIYKLSMFEMYIFSSFLTGKYIKQMFEKYKNLKRRIERWNRTCRQLNR